MRDYFITKINYIIIIAILILSCNQTINKKKDSHPDSTTSTHTPNIGEAKSDTTGLLKNCNLLMDHSIIGSLQVKNASKDSTGFFGFFDNYKEPNTYEIIFVYKGGVQKRKGLAGFDTIRPRFLEGCNNNFMDFDCYAFVLPMRDPEKQDDVDAMNIDFPVMVKAYKRIGNDNWRFVKVLKVKSYDEYTMLQFKTIYGL
jgi:hypothetical protein